MTVYINKHTDQFYNVKDNSNNINLDLQNDLMNVYDIRFYTDDFINGDNFNGRDEFISELNNLAKAYKVSLARALNKHWHTRFINDEKETEDTFNSINNFHDLEFILNFLKDRHYPGFSYWHVAGFTQRDIAYAWCFDYFKEDEFMNNELTVSADPKFYDFKDYLSYTLFGSFIDIQKCDNYGNVDIDKPKKHIAKLYIGFSDYPNYHDEDVDKYMLKAYDAIPANAIIKYY